MRISTPALAIVTLVLATACSGGPATPPAADPELELNVTAAAVAFVEGTDLGGGLEASGTVVAVRFGDPIGVPVLRITRFAVNFGSGQVSRLGSEDRQKASDKPDGCDRADHVGGHRLGPFGPR